VSYRVTAENGTWADYTVTVLLASGSGEKAITAFTVNGTAGVIDEAAKTVTVTLPFGTQVNSLAPDITVSLGASVNPGSGTAQDFAGPVSYRVTAENGTWADYTVTVLTAPGSGEKAMTAFTVNWTEGVIDEAAKTVTVTLPYGTQVNALAPDITVSPGASVDPASGTEQDFANPVSYRVTAEDGTWADYTVTALIMPNTEKAISAFTVNGTEGVINEAAKTVTLSLPYGTQVNSLAPDITVSPDASVDPASGTAQDFTNPVSYRVTAQDGTWADYTVTVSLQAAGNITIHQPPLGEQDIQFTNLIGTDGLVTCGIEGEGYSEYQWYVDDALRGTDSVITLGGYAAGSHTLSVLVCRNGVPYSGHTTFTVE
jgi:hypothetical protein